MKRLFTLAMGLIVTACLSAAAFAQGNPRGKAELELGGKKVSVEYGRPSLKGRSVKEMLDQLNPGEVWRLGADKSTTFMTTGDLVFGDVTVPKGEYSLWARKEADNTWKLVFNKQHGQWGTQHNPGQDLAAVPLKVEKAEKPAEQVTINLEKEGGSNEISIEWGDLELSANFNAK